MAESEPKRRMELSVDLLKGFAVDLETLRTVLFLAQLPEKMTDAELRECVTDNGMSGAMKELDDQLESLHYLLHDISTRIVARRVTLDAIDKSQWN